jgi:DNA-binding XRE family transcriptional regulator
MLPDDPVLRGRLFHAARALLGWTQARVAGAAGVSTAAVNAVEIGRRGPRAPATAAIVAALERAGVRFVAAADGQDQGVGYARAAADHRSGPPAAPALAPAAAPPGPAAGGLARAEACVARQRRLVARLDAVGAAPAAHAELARGLLGEMERALALLRRRRERPGATGSGEAGTASALDVAA